MLSTRLSSLEVYKFTFMAALFVADYMFFIRMPRKDRFPLRILFCFFCFLAAATLYPVSRNTVPTYTLMFGCFFFLTVLLSRLCHDISWNSSLFCAVAGYSVQHIASIVYNLIITVSGLGQNASVYSSAPASFNIIQTLIFIETYAFVYAGMYFWFARQLQKGVKMTITSPFLFSLVCLMMLVEIVLNAFITTRQSQSTDYVGLLVSSGTNLLCTLCVLIIMFGQLLRKNLENELEVVKQLRRQEKRQYNISKETIDMINIKCHDMKHQIHQIRHSGSITNEALKEVEKSIDIYDSIVKTGCDALDVILAEKSLFCQKNNISINCIVDGEKLSFMSETDIYSLFGNLLDNAIRSVMKLEEEKRVISLAVKARGQLLSVNSHNLYEGELHFENGMPQTTSGNKTIHGFGIKSMMMTVQKYGGNISFQANNGIFNVNILFNLPAQNPETLKKGA